jgi:hypothetical protein
MPINHATTSATPLLRDTPVTMLLPILKSPMTFQIPGPYSKRTFTL